MPEISRFFGIIITMYPGDHRPPHFHARYQEDNGVFDLEGNLIEGYVPPKQEKLVAAWALLREDELKVNWELSEQRKQPNKIAPLR